MAKVELTDAQKKAQVSHLTGMWEPLIVQQREMYLAWLRERLGDDAVIVKMESAAVAAGRRTLEDHDG